MTQPHRKTADYLEIPGNGGTLLCTLAIGTYSDEADPEAGRRHRSHTDVGDRLNRAKYHSGTRSAEDAFAQLVGRMVEIARANPACAGASAVIATPGSDPTKESFSETLARDVALGLALPLVGARSRLGRRRSAKEKASKRAGDYAIDAELGGRVLIVDDVFSTGTTLSAVAQAALEAGASECIGLVAAVKLQLSS